MKELLSRKDYVHLNADQKSHLIYQFAQLINENRKALIEKVLNHRTRYLTLVLEDIVNSQNASAVLRTAEAMGLQDIHIIDHAQKYVLNKGVLKGAYKWLNIFKYKETTSDVLKMLKASGYRLYAMDPSSESKPLATIDLNLGKTALIFGNEHFGLSEEAKSLADAQVHIPMHGFTESFNLSVSAAMSLQTLIPRLHQSEIKWRLSESEKDDLRLDWYIKCVPRGHILEKEFLRSL